MNLDWISLPGGQFPFGSDNFYPEERPSQLAHVESFEIMRAPVTVHQFNQFVQATGYVTVAEREIPKADFPHLDSIERAPGSLVFTPTHGPVELSDWRQWWSWVPGAEWRNPSGKMNVNPVSNNFPVTQVAYEDAKAFCDWAGCRLPTELEAEFASRGGNPDETPFAWGEVRNPGGRIMANTWYGNFPYHNEGALGWIGASPVGSFPPNAFGLVDTIGNVWEWTSSYFSPSHAVGTCAGSSCACGPQGESGDVKQRVLKGGSFLCAPEYCLRYRPAARSAQTEDSSTNHIGFRCAR